MSLARRHRDHVLAQSAAAAILSTEGAHTAALAPRRAGTTAADTAAAQINLRLTHDLRRLKEIASVARRIEVKRTMLPEYAPWVAGILQAGKDAGQGVAEAVLPTIMIWLIDTGDFAAAMPLIEHVILHDVPLPSRYQRSAPALIVEEVAMAAIKVQQAGGSFPFPILLQIDVLTREIDMHDEIRAKLCKAIGFELATSAEEIDPATPDFTTAASTALVHLRRAQGLHDRVGAKDRIKRLERALAKAASAIPAAPEQAGTAG